MEFKKPKQKKCAICSAMFTPFQTTQRVCSISCAQKHAEAVATKKMRQEIRQAKEALKTRQDWIREAQRWFNRYIRLRDKDETCISCDKPSTWNGQWHASHYRSTGACPELRFEELNCHKSCSQCNNFLSGNIIPYRKRLVSKIGADNVDWLEGSHKAKKYTIEELQEIKKIYKNKCKELESER